MFLRAFVGLVVVKRLLASFGRGGQNDLEDGAPVIGVVIRDDRPAVALDDRFDNRQAESTAPEAFRAASVL